MSGLPPPPPGIDLDANRGSALAAVQAVTFALATIAVVLRFVTRHYSRAGYWLDDWLVLVAMTIAIAIIGVASKVDHVFGQHVWKVGYTAQVTAMQYAFADEILYNLLLGFTKLSVLALYWRIFRVTPIRTPIVISTAIVVVWVIASVIANLVQCRPVAKNFDIFVPGSCFNVKANFLGNSVTNILTDILLLLLPMRSVWSIKQPQSQRLIVAAMFLCGGLVIIFSGLRLHALLNINLESIDLTWNYTDTWIWSAAEVNIAILSVCLPTLRPFHKFLVTGSFETHAYESRHSPYTDPTYSSPRPFSGKIIQQTGYTVEIEEVEEGWVERMASPASFNADTFLHHND